MIYRVEYDIIYPNIMSKELMEREENLTEVADLCGVDELTIQLWLTDPEYFRELEVNTTDDREMAIMVKGFMVGRQSMLKKGEVDVDSVMPPPFWEHREEFPMSTRKLATLLNVSRSTISKISHALCLNMFQRSRDEQGRYLTWDDAEQIWGVVKQGRPYLRDDNIRVEVEQEEAAR